MTDEQMEMLCSTIKRVASGDRYGPDGIELVAMSIANGMETTLATQVGDVASALERIADAMEARCNDD